MSENVAINQDKIYLNNELLGEIGNNEEQELQIPKCKHERLKIS